MCARHHCWHGPPRASCLGTDSSVCTPCAPERRKKAQALPTRTLSRLQRHACGVAAISEQHAAHFPSTQPRKRQRPQDGRDAENIVSSASSARHAPRYYIACWTRADRIGSHNLQLQRRGLHAPPPSGIALACWERLRRPSRADACRARCVRDKGSPATVQLGHLRGSVCPEAAEASWRCARPELAALPVGVAHGRHGMRPPPRQGSLPSARAACPDEVRAANTVPMHSTTPRSSQPQ